ncbi:MAG: phage tail protein [Crocinitomicaceae bacterium]|nr:phage tail protein [Crocinitomicaceae bacterium]
MSNYVLATHRFTVNWGGTNIGFQEVSGFDHETDVISYEHGAMIDGTAPMKSPGKTKYSDSITLNRGYFKGDTEMQDWLETIRTDETARRTVVVTLLDEQQQPTITWTINKAWPSKIDGISMNSANSEAAIEKITLQHEGYTFEIHS